MNDLTRLLNSIESGDTTASTASNDLRRLIYEELRKLAAQKMARESAGQTLQPTALVHEAWLRLGGAEQAPWQNRAHFFAAAAEAMRRILIDSHRVVGFLLLILLTSGCEAVRTYSVTHKVWNNEEWRHFAGPAPSPHIAIFETTNSSDILVQYDEMNDTSGRIRRRAYLLYANLDRIRENKRPHFVKPALQSGVKSIQLQDSPSSAADLSTPRSYAVTVKGGHEFTVHRAGGTEGPYELPEYLKSNRTAARLLVTPLAVAADTVMVGLVASVVAAYVLAKGNFEGSLH